MLIRKNVLAAMAVLALAGSAFAAQGTATKPAASSKATAVQSKQAMPAKSKAAAPAGHSKSAKPALHQVTGTVVSADATKLVISHEVKGKREEMSFTLSPDTQKSGTLEYGAHASVKYRVENGENVATWVKVTAAAKAKHSRMKKS